MMQLTIHDKACSVLKKQNPVSYKVRLLSNIFGGKLIIFNIINYINVPSK